MVQITSIFFCDVPLPSNCIAKSNCGPLKRPKQQPGQVCLVAVLSVLWKLMQLLPTPHATAPRQAVAFAACK